MKVMALTDNSLMLNVDILSECTTEYGTECTTEYGTHFLHPRNCN